MAANTTTAPGLTPTQVAIAAMRAQRAALGYPATGNEWLLLDALDESEAENAELHARVGVLEKQLEELDEVIESLGIPGRAVKA